MSKLGKYKYYFRKPKSEIVKDILSWLAIAGAIYVAASSPYFVMRLWRNLKRWQKYPKRKFYTAFHRLQKEDCLEIRKKNHQIYITLTEKGRIKAGRFQIDSLEVKRLKKWDKLWRMVIFDISQLRKFYRDLFRQKLKDLGFYQLQKSVWVHAFDCRDEIELLKEFFGLSEKEVCLVVAKEVDNDDKMREFFGLK